MTPKEVGSNYFFLLIIDVLTKCDPKNMFMKFEPTSFMGLGWFKMAFFNNVDPIWSFDHFDSQEGWFKVSFLLIIDVLTKCDPKNMFLKFEPTSLRGLGWFKMTFFTNVDPFLEF